VLGVVLSVIGIIDSTDSRWWRDGGSMTWTPASIDQLRDSYSHGAGEARLDLTAIDFAPVANPVSVNVTLGVGNLKIIVPPHVDVTITAHVDAAGNANVFRESWNGLGMSSRTVTDTGADGPGGGELRINASVTAGNLEVHR
jgi:predicted membrane protein